MTSRHKEKRSTQAQAQAQTHSLDAGKHSPMTQEFLQRLLRHEGELEIALQSAAHVLRVGYGTRQAANLIRPNIERDLAERILPHSWQPYVEWTSDVNWEAVARAVIALLS